MVSSEFVDPNSDIGRFSDPLRLTSKHMLNSESKENNNNNHLRIFEKKNIRGIILNISDKLLKKVHKNNT